MATQPLSKTLLKWAVPLVLVAFIGIAMLSLPGSFNEDLSVIGQGRRVVVLVHDHNYVNSTALMEALDTVRSEFADRIDFRVADVLKPDGKRFADAHQADPVTLLLFSPDGVKQQTLVGVHPPSSLRRLLADF